MTRWLTPILAAVAMVATAAPTLADARYALVIGANDGVLDDERLLYAERDATRVAEVLTRLGGVPAENLILLQGSTAAAVERAISVLKLRLSAPVGAERPVLFVYYSGHADARALHLTGTQLSFTRFKQMVRDVEADVSVFMIDACRSGGLTRVKGAVPSAPFEFSVEDAMTSEGVAIITSSAEGEDAQESDRLRGGIFTHHLINGLWGAADSTQDGRVTLGEAYRYAYGQTLSATTRTRFVQHPTYAFEMKGKRELILTRLADAGLFGRVRLTDPGHYVLIERFGEGGVAAELDVTDTTELVVVPGRYLVRRRDLDAVHEAEVIVTAKERTVVDARTLDRVPYRQTVRRGYAGAARSAWSLGGSFALSAPILTGTGVTFFGAVSAQLDLEEVALQFRLRYGHSSTSNPTLSIRQDLIGLDISAVKLFDIAATPLALGLGVRAGADVVFQTFDSRGSAPSRRIPAGHAGAFVRAEFAPSPAVSLHLDCGADVFLLESREQDGSEVFSTPVAPYCGLGFGVQLP